MILLYLLQSTGNGFNLKELLLGSETWSFLLETVLRSLIMFVVILTGLRLLGKRGVKQLSVFELVVIIGLGSAAGDPMFYSDVGILPAIIVFIMIVSLYSIVTYFIGKSEKFERIIEGRPVCLIRDGMFSIDNFEKEPLAQDEFFAELRMSSVSHLGQVQEAIVETSGSLSIFFYPDNEVKYGLPIMPDSLEKTVKKINDTGYYSCTFCGYTENIKPVNKHNCIMCKKHSWVKASNKKRIS
jgi:uncharacterized membrane protein YcaP (DUF421 family)